MPMGPTNACASFQRMMIKALGRLIGYCCFVYMDDIIIFSASDAEHLAHLQLVADALARANLNQAEEVRISEKIDGILGAYGR